MPRQRLTNNVIHEAMAHLRNGLTAVRGTFIHSWLTTLFLTDRNNAWRFIEVSRLTRVCSKLELSVSWARIRAFFLQLTAHNYIDLLLLVVSEIKSKGEATSKVCDDNTLDTFSSSWLETRARTTESARVEKTFELTCPLTKAMKPSSHGFLNLSVKDSMNDK